MPTFRVLWPHSSVSSLEAFTRSAGLPFQLFCVPSDCLYSRGSVALVSGLVIRRSFGELTWIGLIAQGALLLSLCTLLVVGSDWLLGGNLSPSKRLIERIVTNRRFTGFSRLIPFRAIPVKQSAKRSR